MITTSCTYEYRGLSADDKSEITNMTNGSVFFEIDTSKDYICSHYRPHEESE